MKDITIAISISESEDMGSRGKGLVHLQDAMVETARFLLSKGYNLAYGGDLNYDGPFNFTELLFQLGMTYGNGSSQRIINYATFPIYTKVSRKKEAEISRAAKIIPVYPDETTRTRFGKVKHANASDEDREYLNRLFESRDEVAKQIWADSLTTMRKKMAIEVQGCIALGGKSKGFKGRMPGVREEVLLYIENGVSVYLDSGFGGVCAEMCTELKQGKLNGSERSNIVYNQLTNTRIEIPGDNIMEDIRKAADIF